MLRPIQFRLGLVLVHLCLLKVHLKLFVSSAAHICDLLLLLANFILFLLDLRVYLGQLVR